MSSADVERAYSSVADRYVESLGSLDVVHPEDLRLIDAYLSGATGPVLDLGCGPGHLAGHLRTRGCDVTGIDLVPEFIDHARRTYPDAQFEVGSLTGLGRDDGSVAGVLAWYSLVHVEPDALDPVLAGIRRVVTTGGALVVGFFDGEVCEPFAHKVLTAHRWPVDEFSRRLAVAGFLEVERRRRGQDGERRPHAVIAARAV